LGLEPVNRVASERWKAADAGRGDRR